ncbi:PrsW family glutamic-type intramembrane protease [Phytomonospora sp. NPDC050363]|uniref:PrsW family intramembrane metalloprotease n=1 Tax=Phytomonospora sp. NPDC050363 TaxID=3155642 RepID=UPI00340511BF
MTGEHYVRPTPPGSRRWFDVRNPALWVFAILALPALWVLGKAVRNCFITYPLASTVAAVGFTLFTVPFVIVLRRLDYLEREPPGLVALAFTWGGVVAYMGAVYGGRAAHGLLAKLVSPEFAGTWSAAIGPPIVEEILKALGVVLVVLLAREQVNSTVDGFVYGAFIGLGFQVVEDFGYAVTATAWDRGGDQVGPVVSTFIVRGFLSGLWSHTVFTALAGGAIAYATVNRGLPMRRRVGVVAGAVGVAILAHALWNSPLLRDGFGFGGIGIVAALFIKGLPVFLLVWYLFSLAYRTEASFYRDQLKQYDDTPLVHPEELDALLSYRERESARRLAQAPKGRRGARAARSVRRLQHLQTRLAVLSSRYPEAPEWVRSTVEKPPTRQWLAEERKRLGNVLRARESTAPDRRDLLHRNTVRKCVVDILAARAQLEHLGHPVAAPTPQKSSPMIPYALGLAGLGVLIPGVGVFAIVTALLATRGNLPSNGLAIAAMALGTLTTVGWGIAFFLTQSGAG